MPVVGTDLLVVERAGVLHKAAASEIAAFGGGGGGSQSLTAARVRRSTNQSIPTGTGWTDLVWDASAYQEGGAFWTSGAIVTIPVTGYYQIFAEATFDGAGFLTNVSAEIQALVDGVVVAADEKTVPAGTPDSLFCMTQRRFTAGQQVKVQVRHSMGTAVNILSQGDHAPDVIIARIGAADTPVGLWDYWIEARSGQATQNHWVGAAISAGNNTGAIAAADLQGYNPNGIFLRSGTTANGGYRYLTNNLATQYFGVIAKKFCCAYKPKTAFTGRLIRIGFLDTNSAADAVDGAYFEIDGAGTCFAKTASNSVRTTNPTSIALAIGTNYIFEIESNQAGTEIRFRVYANDSPTAILDVTSTTNIPNTSARVFGSGIVATESSTTASDIGILYMLGEGTVAGFARARG